MKVITILGYERHLVLIHMSKIYTTSYFDSFILRFIYHTNALPSALVNGNGNIYIWKADYETIILHNPPLYHHYLHKIFISGIPGEDAGNACTYVCIQTPIYHVGIKTKSNQ